MRKLILSLIAVSALFAMTASLASSRTIVSAARAPRRCGGLYQPPCKKPTVITRSIVSCQQTGTILDFPISVHANAGLSRATVRRGGKTIKTKKFPGNPTDASFSATVNTHGFGPGLFTLGVTVTDTRGATASKTVHFTICRPKPVFTG
jgi:hypothetical protein